MKVSSHFESCIIPSYIVDILCLIVWFFRMIRRAPGLKLVVEALLRSLKPIGNTVLIAGIFFVVFGILGVQVNGSSL